MIGVGWLQFLIDPTSNGHRAKGGPLESPPVYHWCTCMGDTKDAQETVKQLSPISCRDRPGVEESWCYLKTAMFQRWTFFRLRFKIVLSLGPGGKQQTAVPSTWQPTPRVCTRSVGLCACLKVKVEKQRDKFRWSELPTLSFSLYIIYIYNYIIYTNHEPIDKKSSHNGVSPVSHKWNQQQVPPSYFTRPAHLRSL